MSESRPSLNELEMRGSFIQRHIGSNQKQTNAMLAELGLSELEDLIDQAIPTNIVNQEPLKLTDTISERAVIEYLRNMRNRNKVFTSLIGMGYYDTVMPAVIKRNVLENPDGTRLTHLSGRSQSGTIRSIAHFQQMICDLTGMEIANASYWMKPLPLLRQWQCLGVYPKAHQIVFLLTRIVILKPLQ